MRSPPPLRAGKQLGALGNASPPDIIEFQGTTSGSPGARARPDRLAIRRGEVHVLVGQNGAGKSTLSSSFAVSSRRKRAASCSRGSPTPAKHLAAIPRRDPGRVPGVQTCCRT